MTRPAGSAGSAWSQYLHRFHADRPAITEDLLATSTAPGVGTPYDWLVDGVRSAGVPSAEPATWVDLGCGSAPVQPRLPPARFVGVDVSRPELASARRLGRGPLLQASATHVPLAAGSADAVVASMSIMLVEPIQQALAEIARISRPGAPVGLILPTGWPIAPGDAAVLLAMVVALRGLPTPGRLVELWLPRLLARAGFTVLHTTARRFSRPLADERDARLVVDSLYLPGTPSHRVEAAVQALGRAAGPARTFGVPIRRVLARRGPARPGPGPRRTPGRA